MDLTFTGGPVSFRILDDESAPEVSLTNAMPVAEGGVLRFAVGLDRVSAQPVAVQVRTTDGTALAGGDYTAVNTTVTIPPGQTVGEVFILTTDDSVDEGPQTLALNITGADGAIIGDASGAAEITDNDDPPTLTVTAPAAVDEGTPAVVQFTLDRASERSPRIVFSTQAGAARAPADFTTVPATVLTFGPGQTILTRSVTIHADAEVELQEAFDVVVSVLTPDTVVYPGASRTILINNVGGTPRPALSVESARAVEFNAGSLSVFFPVQLAEPATAAVTLVCRTVSGTAAAGEDFEGISAREIVIEPGETTGVVEVILTPNAAVEMDEEFTLEVTGTLGGQTVAAVGRAYVYPAGIRHITAGNGTVVLTLPVGEGALLESTSQPDAVPWSTVPHSSEPGIQTLTLPRSTARAFYRQRIGT